MSYTQTQNDMEQRLPDEIMLMILKESIEPFNVEFQLDSGPKGNAVLAGLPDVTNLRLINRASNTEVLNMIPQKYTGKVTTQEGTFLAFMDESRLLPRWQRYMIRSLTTRIEWTIPYGGIALPLHSTLPMENYHELKTMIFNLQLPENGVFSEFDCSPELEDEATDYMIFKLDIEYGYQNPLPAMPKRTVRFLRFVLRYRDKFIVKLAQFDGTGGKFRTITMEKDIKKYSGEELRETDKYMESRLMGIRDKYLSDDE